jgi:hypothetical protein
MAVMGEDSSSDGGAWLDCLSHFKLSHFGTPSRRIYKP